MSICLGRKKETKFSLGKTIAEQLSESLKDIFYTLNLVNFFRSPELMQIRFMLLQQRGPRKNMPLLMIDKGMKRVDRQISFSEDVKCGKCMDQSAFQ